LYRILIVEDDPKNRETLARVSSGPDRVVEQASTFDEAIAKIRTEPFDLVITDLRLDKDSVEEQGFSVLEEVVRKGPTTQVIVVTDYGDRDKAATAMKGGAFDYVDRNFPGIHYRDVLPYKINQALEFARRQVIVRERS